MTKTMCGASTSSNSAFAPCVTIAEFPSYIMIARRSTQVSSLLESFFALPLPVLHAIAQTGIRWSVFPCSAVVCSRDEA